MKLVYSLILLIFIFSVPSNASKFITKWDLSLPGSGPNQIIFNVGTTAAVNYSWETIPAGSIGSGTFSGTSATITGLPANAVILLSIDSAHFNAFSATDNKRLIDVVQWGTIKWSTMYAAFNACNNLNITATDIPDLSNVTMFGATFAQCYKLTGPPNIGMWNMSHVTDLTKIFYQDSLFNQPIGNWNTSNVVNMTQTFGIATSFNQPIGNWDIGNVKFLIGMFFGASSFNQPLNNWNTSNVKSFSTLFLSATSFNQPLNNWDVSKSYSFFDMFNLATSFNQSLGNWNVTAVDMHQMFDYSGLDCENYSSTLTGWFGNPLTPDLVNLGAITLHYGSSANNAHDSLISIKTWTIIGDTALNAACYPTGVSQVDHESDVSLYPNPSMLNVNSIINSIGDQNMSLEVTDILGLRIYKQAYALKNGRNIITINTSKYTSGIYFVNYVFEHGKKVVKFNKVD
jgi:surface protein